MKYINPWKKSVQQLANMGALNSYIGHKAYTSMKQWDIEQIPMSVYGHNYASNVYVDLSGHIRPRLNPTPGLYYFDGQFYYRKKGKS